MAIDDPANGDYEEPAAPRPRGRPALPEHLKNGSQITIRIPQHIHDRLCRVAFAKGDGTTPGELARDAVIAMYGGQTEVTGL